MKNKKYSKNIYFNIFLNKKYFKKQNKNFKQELAT